MNLSSSLVRKALTPLYEFNFFDKSLAAIKFTSFSNVFYNPTAPGSLPPCPGSITTTKSFILL